MQADHHLVLSAPSTAESRAVDSKQSARTKPKGFALTALCDCRAFRTKTTEDSRLCQYFAEHGDISRKPLCHLYTYNRRSGSLKAHSNVILATTVSDLCSKTSQWSTQSYQKCSDARKSCPKLASLTGRQHFVQDESSDARKSRKKHASKTGRQHFVREGRSDARESRKKLASRTGRQHFAQDESSDARFRSQKLASRTGRQLFAQNESSDARFRSKKLASRTGKRHFVREVHGRLRRETEPNRAQNQIGA